MVQYRRNYQAGVLYFFTVTLKNRNATLLTDYIDQLKKSLQRAQKERFYETKAIVILPDHIHAIWKMPEADQNYSLHWRKIKSYFTHALSVQGVPIAKNKRGEFNLWQTRFWEHTITNENDLENHINYIHYNPVKHGLVKRVRDWPYSSFHRYVKNGILDIDWGSTHKSNDRDYGERS
jgi:putative transposase